MSVINYRSFNFFLFLFVTSFLVSVCLADISKDISGNFTEELPGDAENDIDDEARARKALRVKDTVIDLCQNLPGCTCDGKHERANCSCNINDEHKLKRLINLSKIIFFKQILKRYSFFHCFRSLLIK
jgi:hypothetical protein